MMRIIFSTLIIILIGGCSQSTAAPDEAAAGPPMSCTRHAGYGYEVCDVELADGNRCVVVLSSGKTSAAAACPD